MRSRTSRAHVPEWIAGVQNRFDGGREAWAVPAFRVLRTAGRVRGVVPGASWRVEQ